MHETIHWASEPFVDPCGDPEHVQENARNMDPMHPDNLSALYRFRQAAHEQRFQEWSTHLNTNRKEILSDDAV